VHGTIVLNQCTSFPCVKTNLLVLKLKITKQEEKECSIEAVFFFIEILYLGSMDSLEFFNLHM
jgi:hypothetical protein